MKFNHENIATMALPTIACYLNELEVFVRIQLRKCTTSGSKLFKRYSGHLDLRKNSKIEEMPGINTSMFYIGSARSFTELHVKR